MRVYEVIFDGSSYGEFVFNHQKEALVGIVKYLAVYRKICVVKGDKRLIIKHIKKK